MSQQIHLGQNKSHPLNHLAAALLNLLLVYIAYMITRVAFVLENWPLYASDWHTLSFKQILSGSLLFDSAAIFYTNSIYLLLVLLPPLCFRKGWQTFCQILFTTVNTLALSANLADSVYSQYTGRRTTWSFFSEFANESNLGNIFFTEVANHWYLVLIGLALLSALIFLYSKPKPSSPSRSTILTNLISILLLIPLSLGAMRGGFSPSHHPIVSSKANQYVHTPSQAAIVLNTPFSMLRSMGKQPFINPHYFPDDQLDSLFSPIHQSNSDTALLKGKNVIVLILEGIGRENFAYYNPTLEHPSYNGYTPFLDSLLTHSLTFQHTLANGRKSIDAMPSVLSSIPMFVEPFFTSSTALNQVGGLADYLAHLGYTTAFFHGAENNSMGFRAFALTSGFQHYYGRTEYEADTRFGGSDDFDGTWTIWDEEFLQFFALQLNELPQPFLASLFTATSHHPFVIPNRYCDTFAPGPMPIHRTVRYTDHALRQFFATARRQPWFNNTLFVITADHTNSPCHDLYRTPLGLFAVPILFFDPSGTLPTGMQQGIAQQTDILPTLLPLLGFDRPFLSYGKNLLSDSLPNWAINYNNGLYQYVQLPYLLLFDGQQPTALYHIVDDPMLSNNLLGSLPNIEQQMTLRTKSIVQSYMSRMTTNNLTTN